jgi:MarR family transcriptional regulator, organic hydroperoxide resistance regulator
MSAPDLPRAARSSPLRSDRTATLEALRSAFIELMGAERRLRGRSAHKAGDFSAMEIRALFQLAKDAETTAGCLAKQADVSPATMTAMLDHLEKDGMVARRRSETDRRQVIVSLTDGGRELMDAKRSFWNQTWRAMLDDHSDDELTAAARVMHDVAGMLDSLGR